MVRNNNMRNDSYQFIIISLRNSSADVNSTRGPTSNPPRTSEEAVPNGTLRMLRHENMPTTICNWYESLRMISTPLFFTTILEPCHCNEQHWNPAGFPTFPYNLYFHIRSS